MARAVVAATRGRCPACNDCWLAGKLYCAACRQPLRVRAAYFRPVTDPARAAATQGSGGRWWQPGTAWLRARLGNPATSGVGGPGPVGTPARA